MLPLHSARALLTCFAAILALGCNRGDPSSCGYWTERLSTDHKEKMAIEKLGKLKCTSEVKALVTFYPNALYRAEIVKTLEGFGNIDKTKRPEVLPVIKQALRDREAGPLAAQLVRSWAVKEAVKDVEELIQSNNNPGARENLLSTLLSFVTPQEILNTLIFLVAADPTTQGVQVNQQAAERLSKLDWSKVDEETKKTAIDRLIMGLFMVDAAGTTSYQAAREALGAIGAASGASLIEALNGKHALLNKTAETYGIPRWQHRDGPELVEVLWDVGDPNSAVAVIKSMARSGNQMPPEVALLPSDKQQKWSNTNSNRMVMGSFILAFLRNNAVLDEAKKILLRPQPWVHQFMQTGNALALMGTPEAQTALFDVLDTLGAQKNVMNQANLLTAVTLALTPDFLARYEATAVTEPTDEAKKQETAEIREASAEALPNSYYLTVKNCVAKNLAPDQAWTCYADNLKAAKGRFTVIRDEVDAAINAMAKAHQELGDKVKPLREEYETLSKRLRTELKPIIETMKDSKKKEEVEKFNATVDEFNKGIERLEIIQKERTRIAEEVLTQPKATLKEKQLAFYSIEKSVITLAHLGAANDETYQLVLDLFRESPPTSFLQFRQWAFVYIERFATKERKAALEALLALEKSNPMAQYFVLRLQHLVKRIDRGS